MNSHERPIPSPVRNLRPARETCEQCHWPEKFHGDKAVVIREYAEDEQNTETVTTLQVHVGGGSERLGVATGIHWHMNVANEIEYVATDDKRQEIPLRAAEGSQRQRHGVPTRRRDGDRSPPVSGAGWTAWTATTVRAIPSRRRPNAP